MKFSAPDWQKEIYLRGFAGHKPTIKTDWRALEESARSRLSEQAFAYVAGGSGGENTMNANRDAFAGYKIVPRVLRNVSVRDTSVSLFGTTIPSPFILAPVGVLELVHPMADLAVSRAATALNTPFVFSNQASFAMEECAALMHESPRYFQLYWSKSRDLVASFVQRAERCGCSALVITLDTTLLGWRPRDLNLGYLPFLEGKGIAQYTSDPVFQKMLDEPDDQPSPPARINLRSVRGLISMVNRYPGTGFFRKLKSGRPVKAVRKFVTTYSNPAVTWSDLNFLRSQTKMKLILKGILHPDDALKAVEAGMDGIIVSNHGGRQIDGAISSLDALPYVVKAVNGNLPVLLDSGIRSGSDAFKAIALGAKAVCIGRPYVYGLAVGGQSGVEDVLRNLMAEFELTMALTGFENVDSITTDALIKT